MGWQSLTNQRQWRTRRTRSRRTTDVRSSAYIITLYRCIVTPGETDSSPACVVIPPAAQYHRTAARQLTVIMTVHCHILVHCHNYCRYIGQSPISARHCLSYLLRSSLPVLACQGEKDPCLVLSHPVLRHPRPFHFARPALWPMPPSWYHSSLAGPKRNQRWLQCGEVSRNHERANAASPAHPSRVAATQAAH